MRGHNHAWLLALWWHHSWLLHAHHYLLVSVHHRRAIVYLHVDMVVRSVHSVSLVCVPRDSCGVVTFLGIKLGVVVFLLLLEHLLIVPLLLLSHGGLLLDVDIVQLE